MYYYIPYHENYWLLFSQLGCGHFCLWSRAKYDLIWCTYSTSSRFLQRRKGNYISSVKMRSGQLKRIYRKMRFFFCASTVVTCVAWLGTPRAHLDAFWLDLFQWGLWECQSFTKEKKGLGKILHSSLKAHSHSCARHNFSPLMAKQACGEKKVPTTSGFATRGRNA